jgi:hypothetical protein
VSKADHLFTVDAIAFSRITGIASACYFRVIVLFIGGRTVFTNQVAMKLGYKWETTEGETGKVKDSFRGTVLS